MDIKIITEERWSELFDPETQPIFGKFPPFDEIRSQFETDSAFKVWKHGAAKRFLRWLHDSKYPDGDKRVIATGLFAAIQEEPPIHILKRRRKHK